MITRPPYEVNETGWGEFEIIIKVFFVDPSEKPVRKKQQFMLHILPCLVVVDNLPSLEVVSE